jgi:hypothetical protein
LECCKRRAIHPFRGRMIVFRDKTGLSCVHEVRPLVTVQNIAVWRGKRAGSSKVYGSLWGSSIWTKTSDHAHD